MAPPLKKGIIGGPPPTKGIIGCKSEGKEKVHHGIDCDYGVNCRFSHTKQEMETFEREEQLWSYLEN